MTWTNQIKSRPIFALHSVQYRLAYSDICTFEISFTTTFQISNKVMVSNFECFQCRPVLVTDAMKNWPALRKWNKQFFMINYGDEAVSFKGVQVSMSDLC